MKHRGIFERRECQCINSARACFWENKSFRCKFGNMFRTHFEGKVTLLKIKNHLLWHSFSFNDRFLQKIDPLKLFTMGLA